MSAAHTPGPWHWSARADGRYRIGAHMLPVGGVTRAIAWAGSPRAYRNDELSAENEANARLIAAAPDLLAALKALVFACAENSQSGVERQAREAAIEAIAAAEGRS